MEEETGRTETVSTVVVVAGGTAIVQQQMSGLEERDITSPWLLLTGEWKGAIRYMTNGFTPGRHENFFSLFSFSVALGFNPKS